MWYKALSQDLLHQWAAHAASVVALHKSRQGPLQQEAVDAALEQLKQCGKAFSSLLNLNKAHLKRIQASLQYQLQLRGTLSDVLLGMVEAMWDSCLCLAH